MVLRLARNSVLSRKPNAGVAISLGGEGGFEVTTLEVYGIRSAYNMGLAGNVDPPQLRLEHRTQVGHPRDCQIEPDQLDAL